MTGDISRSWTDAVTNSMLFSGFDTAQYLNWIEKRSVSVNKVLPQFLHEYTHHWCFDSIVGNTIALLTMRARRKCSLPDREATFDLLRHDLVRYKTAAIMLQPLSEGLALFAEFDMNLGESSIMSNTMSALMLCFGFPLGDTADHANIAVQAMLQTTRRSREYVERKAGIYAHPFECEDGYLAGYLAVKSLWYVLASQCRTFYDRDFFLSFLRSYIYDDPNLTLVILSDEKDEMRASEAIANYISQRFASLLDNSSLCVMVEDWERSVREGDFDTSTIGAEKRTQSRAENKVLALLVEDAASESPQGQFAVHAFATFQERKFVTLGCVDVNLVVADGGRAHLESLKEPRVAYDVVLEAAPGNYSGRVLVITSTIGYFLVVVLVLHPNCYVVRSFGTLGTNDWQDVKRYAVNQLISENIHRDLEENLNCAIQGSALRIITENCGSIVMGAARSLYGTLATLNTPVEACDLVLRRLYEGGLLALLDFDTDLLRALAALSLANTVATDIRTIKVVAAFMHICEEMIDKALRTAHERHGMQLVSVRGEHALSLV